MPQAGWGLLIRSTGVAFSRYDPVVLNKRGRIADALEPLGGNFAAIFRHLDFRRRGRHSTSMIIQTPHAVSPGTPEQVVFHRTELGTILGLYGRMVSAGEWRDYGMSFLRDVAVFSIFRRTAEHPIYRIEKRPKLKDRQGMYAVIGMDGQVLKRGHDLKTVLRVLERKLIRLVD